jgi:hypothetical protein
MFSIFILIEVPASLMNKLANTTQSIQRKVGIYAEQVNGKSKLGGETFAYGPIYFPNYMISCADYVLYLLHKKPIFKYEIQEG